MTIICKNWKCIGTSLSSINLKVLKNPIKSFFIYLKPYFAITNVHILLSFKFAYLKIMKIHIKHAILQQYCNKLKEHVTLLLIIEIDDRLKFSIPRFYL